ncbi:MAG: HAMP domain-containing sensor histidine kinase [Myxococcota bacterium]
MSGQRLYLQICAVVAASLLSFATLTVLLWNALGQEEYNGAIFEKTTELATILLAPVDAPRTEQQAAVAAVAKALDFDITLWSEDGRLLAASETPSSPPDTTLSPGAWTAAEGETQWSTRLPDGRLVVIDLDRIAIPSESVMLSVALAAGAVFIILIMYPFIRSLTRRLERLQVEVERIGSGYLGARVDVRGGDEIAKLANSFNSAAEEIEKLVTAQRLLLANASHELRTPLARIRLGIEMLAQKDDAARRGALKKDIAELDELIDELILMTRLDTGLSNPRVQLVDLTAVVAEECARYRDCTLVGTASEVRGERRMLQRLMRNLVDNAHAYGAPPIEVEIQENLGEVILTVSDAGSGIPQEEREKVFQPFYRVATKHKVPGYGLGLPLVQRIARAHGGSVSILDRPRSAVSVVLPVDDETDPGGTNDPKRRTLRQRASVAG